MKSDHQLRMQSIEDDKKQFARYFESGNNELANSIIRKASHTCDRVGLNVLVTFADLIMADLETADSVKELKQVVDEHSLKCPYCEFNTLKGEMSMRAHIGRKHATNKL